MAATVVWFRELNKWSIPKSLRLASKLPRGWSWVTIEDLVKQVDERVKVEPEKEYKLIGVKWYGEGTFHRETVTGKEISATYLTPVKSGAFIYNRLFAWKTSFAVVPKEHNGFFVSSEFPQFIVDERKILAEFLYLIFRLEQTTKLVTSTSSGSAAVSRNRFKENEFLKFEVALPPLDDQRAIVYRWQAGQVRVIEARSSLRKVIDNLNERLYNHYHKNVKNDVMKSRAMAVNWAELDGWDMKSARAAAFRLANQNFRPLSDFAEEATELVKPYEEPEKEWAVYGVNNKEGVFFSHYQKGQEFNTSYKKIHKDWFFHNPTRSSVGSLGIVPDVPENAVTSPEYQVWKITQGLVPSYVAALIGTLFFISLIQFHRVGAVKQRLYVENLLKIRVPVIPEHEQLKIAESRDKALKQIVEAGKMAKKLEIEIEALILGTKKI